MQIFAVFLFSADGEANKSEMKFNEGWKLNSAKKTKNSWSSLWAAEWKLTWMKDKGGTSNRFKAKQLQLISDMILMTS